MRYFLIGLFRPLFFRLFNSFLLIFFIVQVIQARSVLKPVRETLSTITVWLGTAGEKTERSLSGMIDMTKKNFE